MLILIVDDDRDLLNILALVLRREGHEVLLAHDGEAALNLWKAKRPNLVLLDVEMAKINGWDVCKAIRKESTTPVILLTVSDTYADIIQGFDLGADDYVTKPFNPWVLCARIRAILRRAQDAPDEPRTDCQVVTAGELRLDPQFRSAFRNDEAIQLTPIEFKLLYELVLHQEQALPHQTLTDRIWGYGGVGDSHLLRGHVRKLRHKLEPNPSKPIYIHTVTGMGYTFRRPG